VSLRARLAAALLLVAVVLVGSGAAILGLVRASLLDEVDHQLAGSARVASGPFGEQARPVGPPPVDPRGVRSPFTQLYVAELEADGTLHVLLQSDSPEVPALDGAEVAARRADPLDAQPFDARSADGSVPYRVLAVTTASGGTAVLALPIDRVEGTYLRVRAGVIGVGALVLTALAFASWWVERLGLRPIRQVTDAATAVAGGDVDRRVEPQPRRTEAGRLADAFNVMVARRQEAEAQLRRFVADASHELRTPLATVAGVLELHQSGALPAGPELDDALRRASQETSRMSGLVQDLLLLAHLDEGRPLELRRVDLSEIVADAAVDASFHQRGRTISTQLDDHAYVLGDEQRLRQVVTNLVDNALAHTPDHGTIELRVRAEGDVCVLEVADDGPGMSASDAEHVFDRFFRADTGRSRAAGGSGLGLSIVASIVAAHHGDVSVETEPEHGAVFRVVLAHDRSPVTLRR
jgi:two-component system OmpR family sensor kinase